MNDVEGVAARKYIEKSIGDIHPVKWGDHKVDTEYNP
jgi:hypothetical protein